MSGVLIAASDRPGHIVRIHPKALAAIQYYVVYYCGMIQRFFENPPDERFVIGVGDKGRYHFRKLLERMPTYKRLGEVAIIAIANIAQRTYDPLAFHSARADSTTGFSTNIPSSWKCSGLPSSPNCKRTPTPSTTSSAACVLPRSSTPTMAINAAFAQFWAEKWNQPELSLPYKASGLMPAAEQRKLMKIFQDVPDPSRTSRRVARIQRGRNWT